jgi:hypothetical protein
LAFFRDIPTLETMSGLASFLHGRQQVVVVEEQPFAAELFFEDLVFCAEILNDFLLVS